MMNLKMTTFNKLFLFFLISANVNSATVKDMNKRIKNIDQEIEQKNTRIKAIDTETSQIEKKIKDTTFKTIRFFYICLYIYKKCSIL